MRNGDRNTKFFHLSTIIHRRQYSIDDIIVDSRDWIIDKKDIGIHIRDKFISLFTEEEISCLPNIGNLMLPVISVEENLEMCKILSAKEIKEVIFDMQNLKAPGSDGFPPLFYKQYWHVVGQKVINVVLDFFPEWHITTITQQHPNCTNPQNPKPHIC